MQVTVMRKATPNHRPRHTPAAFRTECICQQADGPQGWAHPAHPHTCISRVHSGRIPDTGKVQITSRATNIPGTTLLRSVLSVSANKQTPPILCTHLYCETLRLGFSMRSSGMLCSSYAFHAARARLQHQHTQRQYCNFPFPLACCTAGCTLPDMHLCDVPHVLNTPESRCLLKQECQANAAAP